MTVTGLITKKEISPIWSVDESQWADKYANRCVMWNPQMNQNDSNVPFVKLHYWNTTTAAGLKLKNIVLHKPLLNPVCSLNATYVVQIASSSAPPSLPSNVSPQRWQQGDSVGGKCNKGPQSPAWSSCSAAAAPVRSSAWSRLWTPVCHPSTDKSQVKQKKLNLEHVNWMSCMSFLPMKWQDCQSFCPKKTFALHVNVPSICLML